MVVVGGGVEEKRRERKRFGKKQNQKDRHKRKLESEKVIGENQGTSKNLEQFTPKRFYGHSADLSFTTSAVY